MKRKWLFTMITSILAITLVTGCGVNNNDNNDPVDEVPLDRNIDDQNLEDNTNRQVDDENLRDENNLNEDFDNNNQNNSNDDFDGNDRTNEIDQGNQ